MSATGSHSSANTAYTNGLNPMYQSLSTQSEYDVIKDSQACLIDPPLPPRVVTSNTLYVSAGDTLSLKHPTLNSNQGDVRFTTVPENSHYRKVVKSSDSSGTCSGGSGGWYSGLFTALVCVVSCISILLSAGVITLCILHLTDTVSIIPPSEISSSSNSNSSSNSSSNNSSNGSSNTSSDMLCSCASCQGINQMNNKKNYSSYNQTLMDIEQELVNISLELMSLEPEVVSQAPISDRLDVLQSRVQSISDSIQQLRIQATNTCSVLSEKQSITEPVELDDLGNQTCPINTTSLNQPIDVTINIGNECTVRTGVVCDVNPNFYCSTPNSRAFIEDGQILMDFVCYVEFMDVSLSSEVANGTASIRQDTFLNTADNQTIFNDLLSSNTHVVGCSCLSYEDVTLSCRYFAKYCNYNRGPINSTTISL